MLRSKKSEAETWYIQGNLCREMMDLRGAIECYSKAIEIDPKHAETWTNLGGAYGIFGNVQKQMECTEKALEINPRDTFA